MYLLLTFFNNFNLWNTLFLQNRSITPINTMQGKCNNTKAFCYNLSNKHNLQSHSLLCLLCLVHPYKCYIYKQALNIQKSTKYQTFNIPSGCQSHMTILCEMEIFNFLWFIQVNYLPLPSTRKHGPPRPPGWGPNLPYGKFTT